MLFLLRWIGWYSIQPIDTHAPNSAGNRFMYACVFSVPSTCIFCALLVNLPPFRNSYPGSHGTRSSPFPTTMLTFVLVAKNKSSELGFLPWRSLASNWCAFTQPACIIYTQHAGAFCGQFVYWCFCFRLWYRPERTHTSFLLVIYLLWCMYDTCPVLLDFLEYGGN